MQYLYLITNLINNRRYCGITNDTKRRWRYDHPISPYPIGVAIRKYGRENFKFEVLKTFETREEAEEAEIAYIAEHDLLNNKNGYNIAGGGGGIRGRSFNTVSVLVYKLNGDFFGEFESIRKASQATGAGEPNISNVLSKIVNSAKGYTFFHSNEVVPTNWFRSDNFGYGLVSKNKRKAVIAQNIETLEKFHFDSAMGAMAEMNISQHHITSCCTGNRMSAGGYVWSYREEEYLLKERLYKADKGIVGRKKGDDKVFIFNSPKETRDALGINNDSIVSACRGRLKTAGGYTWEYRKDFRLKQK